MSTACVDIAAGAARRRRERRLRSWLKHERMTVAMALAEASHHTAPRGQRIAKARGWVRDDVHGHVPEAPTPRSPARGTSASTTMTACRSSGARGLIASLVSGRRSESRGESWSRSLTRHPSFLFSTILSRSWWTPWWKCGRSSTTCCLTSSRSSKCPRFFLTRSRSAPLSEQLVAVPGFEFVIVRRAEGALCLGVVRAGGHTWAMRVHDTGWEPPPAQGGI